MLQLHDSVCVLVGLWASLLLLLTLVVAAAVFGGGCLRVAIGALLHPKATAALTMPYNQSREGGPL